MPFPRYLLLIPLLLSLLGCASQERQRHFNETAFAFERAIRWQTLDDAAAFQKEPQSISPRQRALMKSIKVTGYDVIRTTPAGKNRLRQVVEIRYYNEHRAIERNMSVELEWEYDPERERWQLVSKLPEFGE